MTPHASVVEGPVVIERGTAIPDARSLDELGDRLRNPRLPADDGASWDRGVSSKWLSDLVTAWRDHDFAGQQAHFDAMEHLFAELGGRRIHFLHFGVGPAPAPLILTHGWPSSFLEFTSVVPRLSSRIRPDTAQVVISASASERSQRTRGLSPRVAQKGDR
jgi:Epoxide hydrolase N terminus